MALIGYNAADSATESGAVWKNESNALLLSDGYAEHDNTGQSVLLIRDFDFVVPDNAIIAGIEVYIDGYSATGGANGQINVSLSKDSGALAGTTKYSQQLGTDSTQLVLGGATDLWGTEWDLLDVNSVWFGVRIQKSTDTADSIGIDYVQVRIYTREGIAGEWDIDYDNSEVIHINGYLDYYRGEGTMAPGDGYVVYGITSGTTAQSLGVSPASTALSGTWKFGDIIGTGFEDGEEIISLDSVDYYGETGNGFSVGSTVTGVTSGRGGPIRKIIFSGTTGTIYGLFGGAANFIYGEDLQISAANVGSAGDASGGITDLERDWDGYANGILIETAQGYIDYDTETTAFTIRSGAHPRNVTVRGDTSDAIGELVDDREDPAATTTGRLYLIDVYGTFQDDEFIEALDEIDFDAETINISVGDTVQDSASPTHTWEVHKKIDDGYTGTLYVKRLTGSATFANNDAIFVGGSQYATTNGDMRERDGYATTDGTLTTSNVQWRANHLYTHFQDTFDEFSQMDDNVPWSAQVQNQAYTSDNARVSKESLRRLKSGALTQDGGNDIATNYQTLGTIAGDPNIYLEQSNVVLTSFWDPGQINILVENQQKGSALDNNRITVFAREYGYSYDHFESAQLGGVSNVPLSTASDLDNQTAIATIRDLNEIRILFISHTYAYSSGSGALPSLGDCLYSVGNGGTALVAKVGAAIASGTHTGAEEEGTITNGDTLDVLTEIAFTAQASVGNFAIGNVIQDITGGAPNSTATIRRVEQIGGNVGRLWVTFSTGNENDWTDTQTIIDNSDETTQLATVDGDTTAPVAWTATLDTRTVAATATFDIGDVGGLQPYDAVIDAGTQTVANVYERVKFMCRREAGSATDPGTYVDQIIGSLYIAANSSYPLKKASPLGTFAGGKFFGAQGIFLQNMDSGDIQNYQLIDSNGVTRDPPNQQALTVNSLVVGDSVAVFKRSRLTATFTYNENTPAADTITVSGEDFVDEGFIPGATITVSGTASNNGTYTIAEVDTLTLTLVDSDDLAVETVSSTIVGSNVNKDQFSGTASGNDEADGDFVVVETLPTDLPSSGVLTIVHKNGSEVYEDLYSYTSYSASTFTLSSTLVRDYDDNARVYVPLMRRIASSTEESVILVFSSEFSVLTRVRNGGQILPFEVPGSFGSTGLTVSAIRTTDPIVE